MPRECWIIKKRRFNVFFFRLICNSRTDLRTHEAPRRRGRPFLICSAAPFLAWYCYYVKKICGWALWMSDPGQCHQRVFFFFHFISFLRLAYRNSYIIYTRTVFFVFFSLAAAVHHPIKIFIGKKSQWSNLLVGSQTQRLTSNDSLSLSSTWERERESSLTIFLGHNTQHIYPGMTKTSLLSVNTSLKGSNG